MPHPADEALAPGTAHTFSGDAGPARRGVALAPPSSHRLHSDSRQHGSQVRAARAGHKPPAPHMPIEPLGELALPGL